ncbi:hypothetical protein JCM10450v2_005948 [Rhodotorula kratochvilovae]
MDFLTQPLASAARSPPAQAYQSVPPTSTSTAAPPAATSSHDAAERASLVPSVATSATSDQTALDHNASRFASLRTADTAVSPSAGLPGEPVIDPPSIGKGDWRAYGRVKAQVVLWPEGTVGLKSGKKLRDCDDGEEWVVEGTLWVTKNHEIVLILDHDKAPVHADRTKARMSPPGRRLSIGSFGRTSSREIPSANEGESAPAAATTTADEAAPPAEHKSPVLGFVKKVLSAVTPGKSSHGESAASTGEGLGLTRTRTGERAGQAATGTTAPAADPQRRQSVDGTQAAAGAAGAGHGGLTFEEPERTRSPFPTYKGHSVTALYISSPSAIHSVRFYPHRTCQGPGSPGGTNMGKDLPISAAPGAATGAVEEGRPPGSDETLLVHAPVVELDVADKSKAGFAGADEEGRKREVTVGFVFKDILLMNEAESFRQRVETLLHGSSSTGADSSTGATGAGAAGGGFGSVLKRTISGKSGAASGSVSPGAAAIASDPAGGHVRAPQAGGVEDMTGEPVVGTTRPRRGSWLKGMPQGDVWV